MAREEQIANHLAQVAACRRVPRRCLPALNDVLVRQTLLDELLGLDVVELVRELVAFGQRDCPPHGWRGVTMLGAQCSLLDERVELPARADDAVPAGLLRAHLANAVFDGLRDGASAAPAAEEMLDLLVLVGLPKRPWCA